MVERVLSESVPKKLSSSQSGYIIDISSPETKHPRTSLYSQASQAEHTTHDMESFRKMGRFSKTRVGYSNALLPTFLRSSVTGFLWCCLLDCVKPCCPPNRSPMGRYLRVQQDARKLRHRNIRRASQAQTSVKPNLGNTRERQREEERENSNHTDIESKTEPKHQQVTRQTKT